MNIFEGAKFGDRYITTDGRLAIFIASHLDHVSYIVKGERYDYAEYICDYNGNGLCTGIKVIANKEA